MEIRKVTERLAAETLFKDWRDPYLVLDTETTSLDPFVAKVISFTASIPDGSLVFYIPGEFLSHLSHLQVPIVAHNFKYDFHVCYRNGVDLRKQGLLHDTMLLDHLINEEEGHGLDDLVKRHYNDPYKEIFWSKYDDISKASEEDLMQYACKDASYTARLYQLLLPLAPHPLSSKIRDFALALYDSELRGILIDLPYLNEMGLKLSNEISLLENKFKESCLLEIGEIELELYEKELDKRKTTKGRASVCRPRFNLSSTAHLGGLLYDKLGLPEQKSKKGTRTVDDAALETLAKKETRIEGLRHYRGAYKVKTSFIDGTLEKMHGNRIHPSFNINGTVTGRISSSNPNMQQLPRDGGVRGIYVPDPGFVFLSYDYSQLEVTLAAHFSRDTNLLKIISEGASQHDITAAGLGISRDLAKTINFAMQYGAGVQKVQTVLGCTATEAQKAFDDYWKTYSGLHRFVQECHKKIEDGQPLVNPFGRARHLPSKASNDIKWGNQGFFSKRDNKYVLWREIYWNGILRQGPNSLIQGTGADCTDLSLTAIHSKLTKLGIGYAMFPIHDEVLIQVRKDAVAQAKEIMQTEMVSVGEKINLTVPLKVEGGEPMSRWEKS